MPSDFEGIAKGWVNWDDLSDSHSVTSVIESSECLDFLQGSFNSLEEMLQ